MSDGDFEPEGWSAFDEHGGGGGGNGGCAAVMIVTFIGASVSLIAGC